MLVSDGAGDAAAGPPATPASSPGVATTSLTIFAGLKDEVPWLDIVRQLTAVGTAVGPVFDKRVGFGSKMSIAWGGKSTTHNHWTSENIVGSEIFRVSS